ncbi:MAG: heme o synthase [Pseudomonadota bacterium]
MSAVEQSSAQAGISEAMPADYIALMKPRVMRLVVFTALTGMLLAPGALDPVLATIAIIAIAIGAGASGALNMWYDADIDAVMSRTTKRPIPAGAINPTQSLNFGIVMSVLSVLTLGLLVNWLSAAILAFTIFFYAVVYTMWLKRSTPQNIVIGGAAGAFPPMLGWACTTGTIGWESVVLFAIIFIWTPPHFWALALWKMRDYDDAHVPMMPNVAGETSTRRQMLVYSSILAPLSVTPTLMGFAGVLTGVLSAALGAAFLYFTFRVWQIAGVDETLMAEKKLFGFSIFYLFALFALLLVDAIVFRATGAYLLGAL